jgi:hypothetical protein
VRRDAGVRPDDDASAEDHPCAAGHFDPGGPVDLRAGAY